MRGGVGGLRPGWQEWSITFDMRSCACVPGEYIVVVYCYTFVVLCFPLEARALRRCRGVFFSDMITSTRYVPGIICVIFICFVNLTPHVGTTCMHVDSIFVVLWEPALLTGYDARVLFHGCRLSTSNVCMRVLFRCVDFINAWMSLFCYADS